MIKKIISLIHLKEVEFHLSKIQCEEIYKIKDVNYSINSLIIYWENINSTLILSYLRQLFQNLRKINLIISKTVNIICDYESIDKLIDLKIDIKSNMNNLENAFPFFIFQKKVIFQSLIHFSFKYKYKNRDIKFNLLEILVDNVLSMSNLKSFELYCLCKDINKKEYENKIIIKLLSKKLDILILNIKTNKNEFEIYNKNEIKEIFKDINFMDYRKLIINKLPN